MMVRDSSYSLISRLGHQAILVVNIPSAACCGRILLLTLITRALIFTRFKRTRL